MTRRDWYWWRFHLIYRASIESSFGFMFFRGTPWTHGWTFDIWTGRRFWTFRFLR